MMIPAGGMNFVEMKKKRTSRHFLMGLSASAYAVGTARIKTKAVEIETVMNELRKKGTKPRSLISRYCSKVGVKMIFGGSLIASASDLKPVSTVYKTGKKTTNPTAQARMAQPIGARSLLNPRRLASFIGPSNHAIEHAKYERHRD